MVKNKKIKIELMFPNSKYVKYMQEVSSVKAFENGLVTIDGLYSETVFGPVGSDVRMSNFGYIDLGISVVHPLIWKAVTKKKMYRGIVDGTTFVTFDNEIKDFIISDSESGNTGYHYFFTNLPRVDLLKTESQVAKDNVNLYNKYRENVYYDKLLVLPAGLRDYTIDKSNRIIEIEINEYYTRILSMTGLTKAMSDVEHEDLNSIRLRLQEKVNDLYDYLMDMIDGKHKFINGSFTATNIDYSTRNVATGIPMVIDDLENVVGDINTAQIGLLQFVKSVTPMVQYEWAKFISDRYFVLGQDALLVNKVSKLTGYVTINSKTFSKFSVPDEIDAMMSNLLDDDFKNKPIDVDGYWLLMVLDKGDEIIVYERVDNTIDAKIIEELRPITYGELFYILTYRASKTTNSLITRYPIASEYSIYPSKVLIRTTHVDRAIRLTVKDELGGTTSILEHYPILGERWVPGISPSSTRLKSLGADFDGDKLGQSSLLTMESNEEVDKLLNSLAMYVDKDSGEVHNINDNVCKRTFATLTKV